MLTATITSENRGQWQTLANELSKKNPLNKKVRVVGGKKHKGKEGVMVKQIRDQFDDSWRYCNDAQATYREMEGVFGYCGLIECSDGHSFWVKCTYLEII